MVPGAWGGVRSWASGMAVVEGGKNGRDVGQKTRGKRIDEQTIAAGRERMTRKMKMALEARPIAR